MKFSKIIICTLITVILLTTTGCGCEHEWQQANCITPPVCKICGTFEGEALGHTWKDATCTEAKSCTVCNTTEGEPAGHIWTEATMDAPKTCTVCNTTEGTKLMLSSSVGKVLASGYEGNDFYELVATEEQSYNGVTIKFGVIKNNEWLRPLSQDIPFYDKDGTPYGSIIQSIYNNFEVLDIAYLGNGCFIYTYNERSYIHDCTIIYNAETGKSYKHEEGLAGYFGVSYVEDKSRKNIVTTSCPYVLLSHQFNTSATLLDTNSMQVRNIDIKPGFAPGVISPISEGIFAVTEEGNANWELSFLDLNGNIINKEKFISSDPSQTIKFINRKCTFNIQNDAGAVFTVTMDKNGNIIESKPKN